MHFRALEMQCSQDATCSTCWSATELPTRIVEQYNVSNRQLPYCHARRNPRVSFVFFDYGRAAVID